MRLRPFAIAITAALAVMLGATTASAAPRLAKQVKPQTMRGASKATATKRAPAKRTPAATKRAPAKRLHPKTTRWRIPPMKTSAAKPTPPPRAAAAKKNPRIAPKVRFRHVPRTNRLGTGRFRSF